MKLSRPRNSTFSPSTSGLISASSSWCSAGATGAWRRIKKLDTAIATRDRHARTRRGTSFSAA